MKCIVFYKTCCNDIMILKRNSFESFFYIISHTLKGNSVSDVKIFHRGHFAMITAFFFIVNFSYWIHDTTSAVWGYNVFDVFVNAKIFEDFCIFWMKHDLYEVLALRVSQPKAIKSDIFFNSVTRKVCTDKFTATQMNRCSFC